jgi:hypothetical protein
MPLIWYDILHVFEVLTQFPHLKNDKSLLEMINITGAKADKKERFAAESVWKPWSGWEFGQKKEPFFGDSRGLPYFKEIIH